jgi:hypothetical protein
MVGSRSRGRSAPPLKPSVGLIAPRYVEKVFVDRLLTDGTLAPFLSHRMRTLRVRVERAIRAKCSEDVILQVHDACYAPVKRATASVQDAIQSALDEALPEDFRVSSRAQHRSSLTALRDLLDSGAKERTLQNALVPLLEVTCRVVQEVTMNATEDHRGMRMDLVLESETAEEPTQIVELKRGSHLLLARRGKPTEWLSRQLEKALGQVQEYGRRLESDAAATALIEARHALRVHNPELRLIAGRRLPNDVGYHLLSSAESTAAASGLDLQIYTWDALLAELERVLD